MNEYMMEWVARGLYSEIVSLLFFSSIYHLRNSISNKLLFWVYFTWPNKNLNCM
jgi:hypothetical protein